MEGSDSSEEELFDIHIQPNLLSERNIFLYDDPLLVSGMLRAVAEEDLNKVIKMIASGKSVNINDNNGNTPLHIAVIKNNIEILECLLSQEDVVINVRNFMGETPVFYAVKMGRLKCLEILIKAGANVNLPNIEEIYPLHGSVSQPKLAHLLILHGAQINAIDYSGDTPLHDAVTEECLETVCMLLYYNAEANITGGNNLTPFMKAVITENIEIQTILFEYIDDFNTASDDGMTVLALALSHDTPFIEDIVNKGADVNYINRIACAFSLCLRIPNYNNFRIVWNKLIYGKNVIDLDMFFTYLDRNQIEKYFEIIVESENIELAVECLTKHENYFYIINKLYHNDVKLELITTFTCRLLEYGYRMTTRDIHLIFLLYGYCELINILLFMDNNYDYGWDSHMIVPRLIFEPNFSIGKEIRDISRWEKWGELPEQFKKTTLIQLLELYIYPPLIEHLILKYQSDPYMMRILMNLPKVPLLSELARNATRKHIYQSFKICSTSQFYTIIKHLNISTIYKKILTLEKKLYIVHCTD